ncbi:hypothetical protein ACHHYP_07855 [Achlya hypogyna]|uniref:Uncharacterized protein n=1 Tax=Achlya hypogyna TaxID=1202772 RepID=A0A1V9ZLG1_ACHHY|nr:hypothetical protein ACHHYP_07855 [Achlya hypogyna]
MYKPAPWETAIGATPLERTVKVAHDAKDLYRAHGASMHSVNVEHLQEIGSTTLHLESHGRRLTKPKSLPRKKRIEHSFEPSSDAALHKDELDQILMAEEWDTRYWNTVKINEAINTLYIEIERGIDERRRQLAIQMMQHLNQLHPEAYAYNENNMPTLSNKAFTKLTATTANEHVFNMAELIAVFADSFPLTLASENAVLRALQCILRPLDVAARVLQHMRRRVVFERSLRRREISLEARMRSRAITLAKTIDLQRQQQQVRAALRGGPLPARAAKAYMSIILTLVSHEFDHRNEPSSVGRQDRRRLHHTGGVVWLVQCVRSRGELEPMALQLLTILAHDKDRVRNLLQSHVVHYLAANLRDDLAASTRTLVIGLGAPAIVSTTIDATVALLDVICASVATMVQHLERPRTLPSKKLSLHRSMSSLSRRSGFSDVRPTESSGSAESVDDSDAVFLNRDLPAVVTRHLVTEPTFRSLFALVSQPAHTLATLQVLHKLAQPAVGYLAFVDVVTRNAGRFLEVLVNCLTSADTGAGLAALHVLFALAAQAEGRDALTTAGLVHLVSPLCRAGFRRPGNSYRFVLGLVVIVALANTEAAPLSLGPSPESLTMALDVSPAQLLDFAFVFLLRCCRADSDGRVGAYVLKVHALEFVLDLLVQPLQTPHAQTRFQRHVSTIVLAALARVRAIASRLTFRDDLLHHVALVLQTNRMEESEGCELHLQLESTAEAARTLLRCLRAQMQTAQPPVMLVAAQDTVLRALFKLHAIEDLVAYIRPPNLVSDDAQTDIDAVLCAIQLVGLVCPAPLFEHVNHETTRTLVAAAKEVVLSLDGLQALGSRLIHSAASALLNTLAADQPLPRVVKCCCKALAQLACTNASASLLLDYRCLDVVATLVPNVPSSLAESGSSATVITSASEHDDKLLALPAAFYTLLATLCRVQEGRAAVAKLNVLPRVLKRLHLRSAPAALTRADHRCRTELMALVKAIAHANAVGLGNVNELLLRHHVHTVCVEMLDAAPEHVDVATMHEHAMGTLGALAKDHMRCVPPLLAVGALRRAAAAVAGFRDHDEGLVSVAQLESALQILLGISLFPSETVQTALANGGVQDDLLRIGCSFHLEMIKSRISAHGAKSVGEMARETLRHMGDFAKRAREPDATAKARSPAKLESHRVSLPALEPGNNSRPPTPAKAASMATLPDVTDLRHTRPPGPRPNCTEKPPDVPFTFARPKQNEALKYPFLLLDPLFGAIDFGVDPSVPGLALRQAQGLTGSAYPGHATSTLGHHVVLRRSPAAKEPRLEPQGLSSKHKPKQ